MKDNKKPTTMNSPVAKAAAADALPQAVQDVLTKARSSGKSVVLATGVFDVVHQEHIVFIKKARQVGDILVIGIESDVRVRAIKGESRPVNSEAKRALALSKISEVDCVFILPENFSRPEQHKSLIETIKPDVLAVSSHTSHLKEKSAILKQVGGEVKIVHQHNPKVSTTLLLKNSKKTSN